MSENIEITLEATDEASATIAAASDSIDENLNEVTAASENVAQAQNETNASGKDLAMGFSGLATSGFSLYMAFDRIENSNVSLDRANLNVQRSTQALALAQQAAQKAASEVSDAQTKYDAAVEKYGVDSPQATAAATALTAAQQKLGDATTKVKIDTDALTVSHERDNQAQNNYNNTLIMAGLTVIPTVITAIGSLSAITSSWTAVQGLATAATTAFGTVLDFVAANPIVLIVAAIALIILALYEAYQHCGPFRDAINEIGKVLGGALSVALKYITEALTWLWNNVLVPLGNFIINYFKGVWEALTLVYEGLSYAVTAVYNGLKWLWDNVFSPLANFIGFVFKIYLQELVLAWDALSIAVNTVYNALNWFYQNVLRPVADFVGGTLLSAWNAFASGLSWVYNSIIKPVFDALQSVYNAVIKPLGNAIGTIGNALGSVGNTVGGAFKAIGLASGGVVMEPTLAMVGEQEPEMVIPLSALNGGSALSSYASPTSMGPANSGSVTFQVNSPLVVVQGSADKATVDLATQQVLSSLKTIIVEQTSSQTAATQKRIRNGGKFS